MAVFHQMGHHSNNLIDLPDMSTYAGAIFSPINCTQAEAIEQIERVVAVKPDFEILFDPQLYVPATSRGKLRKWPYFPRDIDTGDPTSETWWTALNGKLAAACKKIKIDSVCSPAIIPKNFDDGFYASLVMAGNQLADLLDGQEVLQTVLAGLADLSRDGRALEVASMVSATQADRIYLVFVGTTVPRRELVDGSEILGAMQLINALERNGLPVLVGFCSSDVVLWKSAGASDCASGKFFNLRRFTRERFDEPTEGGGQLPYWFEEGLMSFLRQSDLARVRKLDLLSDSSKRNPFGCQILEQIDEANRTRQPLKSWLALSWRQFLYWFADAERRLSDNVSEARDMLTLADQNWSKLDQAKVLMEERQNDGTWIRNWLNTLREFQASQQ
jgi:hypothetical protein